MQMKNYFRAKSCAFGLGRVALSGMLIWVFAALAQSVDSDVLSGRPVLGSTGQLFTVQFTPGDRRLTVHVAGGASVAQLDPSQIEVMGLHYPLKRKVEALDFAKVESHYEIRNELAPGSAFEVNVKDKKSKKLKNQK